MAAWFWKKKDDDGERPRKVVIAEGLWVKCDSCKEIVYRAEVDRAGRVCPKCGYPFRISARERIASLTGEAVVTGTARIGGYPVALAVFEFSFLGGSMASVVGEKLTRTIELALQKR